MLGRPHSRRSTAARPGPGAVAMAVPFCAMALIIVADVLDGPQAGLLPLLSLGELADVPHPAPAAVAHRLRLCALVVLTVSAARLLRGREAGQAGGDAELLPARAPHAPVTS